jgi:hypothetical protein
VHAAQLSVYDNLPRHGRGHWLKSSIAHVQEPLRLQGFLSYMWLPKVELVLQSRALAYINVGDQVAVACGRSG